MKDDALEREVQRQLEIIKEGTVLLEEEGELLQKLRRSLKEKKPLRVKLGADPSAPDLHLGHAVVLRKLRQFQDLGHKVLFLIGDFTGRIGDPTERSETRRQLSEEEVQANARTYERQVFRILDPERTEIHFNSRWLAPLTFAELVELASTVTVARLLERDDFAKRFREGRPISLHEFFYPLMQGYDSVALKADVELGGTDQTFNLMTARQIQRHYGQEPEVIITLPLLEGLDGVQKMSKSLGNYVALEDPPDEMYGKIMSLPDHLMIRYFRLVTAVPKEEVDRLEKGLREGTLHPRDVKSRLAFEVVSLYHSPEEAAKAQDRFDRVFRHHDLPEEMPEVEAEADLSPVELLVLAGLAASRKDARRLIQQRGVRLGGRLVEDPQALVEWKDGDVLQVGRRRFVRLRRRP
ncbi:MAG: tyrosine--tRNA ligase [Clostridiales bacterium]|nr:tyrosine--tRNA ligase [Clostridiales bacterium]